MKLYKHPVTLPSYTHYFNNTVATLHTLTSERVINSKTCLLTTDEMHIKEVQWGTANLAYHADFNATWAVNKIFISLCI